MALILLLQTLFGNLFVIRTLMIFHHRGLIRESAVTKTGTIIMTAIIFVPLTHIQSVFINLFLSTVLAISPLLIFIFMEFQQVRQLQARFLTFMDHWILNMHLGNAVTSARDKALREQSSVFQTFMRPLFETQKTGHHAHVLVPASVAFELNQICSTTHSACLRLENLRFLLQKSSEFRHRSGQAVMQTAIQSAVMLVLLLALIVFTINRYGWTRCGDLILASSLLSLTGVGVMLRLARKTKWKL